MKPGSMVRPRRSIWVGFVTAAMAASRLPTWAITPSSMATAVAYSGASPSIVRIVPLW